MWLTQKLKLLLALRRHYCHCNYEYTLFVPTFHYFIFVVQFIVNNSPRNCDLIRVTNRAHTNLNNLAELIVNQSTDIYPV